MEFRHPSTFDTLAIERDLKSWLSEDVTAFANRTGMEERLSGAGSGKSSLIAAMANFLRYDVYDLELDKGSGASSAGYGHVAGKYDPALRMDVHVSLGTWSHTRCSMRRSPDAGGGRRDPAVEPMGRQRGSQGGGVGNAGEDFCLSRLTRHPELSLIR